MQKHGYLIDMDGVLYHGNTIIDGAKEFIETLHRFDVPHLFLTNNSGPTQRDIALKLRRKLGVEVSEKNIYTSALATGQFLANQKPNGSAYVLGEGGLLQAIYDVGYAVDDHDPDFVVVGEWRSLNLHKVEEAIDFILGGARLIATNLDPSPKLKDWPKPGTGAVVAMLEKATGRTAFSVGKPSPILMRAARKELSLGTENTTIIGDTIETDILGGIQMGYQTVLVLTGSTVKEDLKLYPYQPHTVIPSIADMISQLEEKYA